MPLAEPSKLSWMEVLVTHARALASAFVADVCPALMSRMVRFTRWRPGAAELYSRSRAGTERNAGRGAECVLLLRSWNYGFRNDHARTSVLTVARHTAYVERSDPRLGLPERGGSFHVAASCLATSASAISSIPSVSVSLPRCRTLSRGGPSPPGGGDGKRRGAVPADPKPRRPQSTQSPPALPGGSAQHDRPAASGSTR
jgi:hypothetical protein